MPRSLLVLVLSSALTFPSVAAIVPGPDVELTRPVFNTPAYAQSQAQIASDGRDFLAVWTESAAATPAVHAARVAADGTRIDDTPLVIADTAEYEQYSDVIWDGARYVVVWAAEREGVFGRFVETDGTMSEPFKISEKLNDLNTGYQLPQVAFNGREYMVLWREWNPSRDRAATFDANGRVTNVFDFGQNIYSPEAGVTAVDGDFYVVNSDPDYALPAFAEGPPADLGLTRIGMSGVIGRRTVVATTNAVVADLRVASDGDESLVAWTSISNEGRTIRSVRITASGTSAVESFDVPATMRLDAVVADGAGFLIVYGHENERLVRRVGGNGSQPIASMPGSRVIAGATGARGPVLVSAAAFAEDLYLHRTDDDRFEPLAVAARHQVRPHIAASGSLRLAVWDEQVIEPGRRSTVMAARIDAQGRVLDPDGIDLGVPTPWQLRVSGGPNQWLVVWGNLGIVYGMRVALDGSLLDATPIVIAEHVHYSIPTPSWDGSRYTIVFSRGTVNRFGGTFTVMAARMTAEGVVESPELVFTDSSSYVGPTIASGAQGSLVAWSYSASRVHQAALVSTSGTVTPLGALPPVAFTQGTPAVAWNGKTFLVASQYLDRRIRWFLVSPNGVVTTPPETTAMEVPASADLSVQSAGDRFVLTYRYGTTIYAAVINGNGFVDEQPVAVATVSPYDSRFAASGTTLVFSRGTDPLRAKLSRMFVKELELAPNPPRRRAVR